MYADTYHNNNYIDQQRQHTTLVEGIAHSVYVHIYILCTYTVKTYPLKIYDACGDASFEET